MDGFVRRRRGRLPVQKSKLHIRYQMSPLGATGELYTNSGPVVNHHPDWFSAIDDWLLEFAGFSFGFAGCESEDYR